MVQYSLLQQYLQQQQYHQSSLNQTLSQKYLPWTVTPKIPSTFVFANEFGFLYDLKFLYNDKLHELPSDFVQDMQDYTVGKYNTWKDYMTSSQKQSLRQVCTFMGFTIPEDDIFIPPHVPVNFHDLIIYESDPEGITFVPFCIAFDSPCNRYTHIGILVLTDKEALSPALPRIDALDNVNFNGSVDIKPTSKQMELTEFFTAFDEAIVNELNVLHNNIKEHMWYIQCPYDIDHFRERAAVLVCEKLSKLPRIDAIKVAKYLRSQKHAWHSKLDNYIEELCECEATFRFYSSKAKVIQTYFKRAISDPSYDMCKNRLLKEFTEISCWS